MVNRVINHTLRKFMLNSDDLRTERAILSLFISLVVSLIITLSNGFNLTDALMAALKFSIFTSAIVAVLAWAVDITKQKGYSGAVGFFSLVILNIFGILLILLLPDRHPNTKQ